MEAGPCNAADFGAPHLSPKQRGPSSFAVPYKKMILYFFLFQFKMWSSSGIAFDGCHSKSHHNSFIICLRLLAAAWRFLPKTPLPTPHHPICDAASWNGVCVCASQNSVAWVEVRVNLIAPSHLPHPICDVRVACKTRKDVAAKVEAHQKNCWDDPRMVCKWLYTC